MTYTQTSRESGKVVDFAAYATLPPQNTDAEEAVLGCILLDPGAMTRVVDTLQSEAFYLGVHQEIYKAMLDLHENRKPCDLMYVSSWLHDNGLLKKIGGQDKLAELVDKNVCSANADRYASLVADKYRRRKLIEVGNEIVKLGYEVATDLPSVVNEAQSRLMEATTYQQVGKGQAEAVSSLLSDVFDEIEQGDQPGYKTGLLDLDSLTAGFAKKDLIVIGARPSVGKTFLGCYVAKCIAESYDLPVVIFSAEMDKKKLTKRFLSMESGIDLARLVQNRLEGEEWKSLAVAVGKVSQMPIYINDTPGSQLTPHLMRSELRRIQVETGKPIGMVVLDYIQKLGDRKSANRAQQVGYYAGEAKDIAKEFDCPFVALAQINRSTEGQADKRPSMSQLKDSGDIEQDADTILLLFKPDENTLEINAEKNRNGPTGKCKILFKPQTGFYGSLQQDKWRD